MLGDPVGPGHTSYDDFVAGFPGEPLDEELEGFPMLYSSGTTGHPKGIRRPLSAEPFGTSGTLVPMLEHIMGFGEGSVYLSPAPLYHSAPLVWSMTAQRMGGTVVLVEQDINRALDASARFYCFQEGRLALTAPTKGFDRAAISAAYFGI